MTGIVHGRTPIRRGPMTNPGLLGGRSAALDDKVDAPRRAGVASPGLLRRAGGAAAHTRTWEAMQ